MKVFIRSTKNGWYYQGPSQWTSDQATAFDLRHVARAVEKIFQAHLENVEILLCYDEPRYDLVLPVPATPSRAEHLKPRRHTDQDRRGADDSPPHPRKK
jgi:hypothetical protein